MRLTLLACAVALAPSVGCSSAPPRLPPVLQHPPCNVGIALQVKAGAEAQKNMSCVTIAWEETLSLGPDGRPSELLLQPTSAARWEGNPASPKQVALPYPKEIRCARRADAAPEQVLLVRMEGLPDDAREGWMALFSTLLLSEELPYVMLPKGEEAAKDSWQLDLDAPAFARRTRLGVWAEAGLTLKGEVGFLPEDKWPSSSRPALLGIVEVRRAAGQVIRLQADIVFDGDRGDIDSAILQGRTSVPTKDSTLEGDFRFQMQRGPLPGTGN